MVGLMENKISKFNKRLECLRSERSYLFHTYRELSDYFLNYRGRFLTTEHNQNRPHKRNTRQYNNATRVSARTLASGMQAGVSSPGRPWFRLGAPSSDPDLKEYAPVKQWLFEVEKILYAVFQHSNFYNSLHMLYAELGVFGTAAMAIYKDFNNVIWCKPETVGSYMLGSNGRNEIDTRYREYEKTVGEIVKEFGIENCSQEIKTHWQKGHIDKWMKVVHVIEPNDDRDMMSPLARDKKFRSYYYEYGKSTKERENKFLRASGFDSFPVMAPRWDRAGEEVYASNCPGMDAIGDAKALQLGEKRKYQALDKIANPPLQGGPDIRNILKKGVGSILGSEIVAVDDPNQQLSSIYGNWRPDLNAIRQDNQEVEMRIKTAFYVDLFLMISQSDRRQITAREIAEKQEEKLIMLGPVLENVHTELLDPAVDRTFEILSKAGVLPPPPRELVNKDLKIEYVSVLAQAQKMIAATGTERVAGFAADLSAVWPEARHKIDAMQMIDDYSEAVGVNPKVIRSDDEAAEIVAGEQAAAAQAQQMASAQQMAEVAKTASEADTSGDNALTQVAQGLAR
jgi:hypothetical protein